MIDFEKCKKEFDKYASDFDMSIPRINRKYYHTYRVVEFAERIAKSENLNEHDFLLAKVCALLHDIARFRQAVEFDTFNDNISFDHGDVACEILLENDYIYKYLDNEEDTQICFKAVRNHNKYAVENRLTDREVYFANLLRDSDKLDIMNTQKNSLEDERAEIMPEVIEALKNHTLYHKDKEGDFIRSNASTIVLQLCFLFDFNFKESFQIVKENKIIERKLSVLREKCNKELVDEIERIIVPYLDSKI